MSTERDTQARRMWDVVSQGSFAVMEEGLFAGSNFLIGVLLARWLQPTEYGVFTTAFSSFLLIGTAFYAAICLQPVLVFGARERAEHFSQYFASLLCVHCLVAAVMSLILAGVALAFRYAGSADMAKTFLALAVAAPMITLLWLARRIHYALLQPHWPLCCGVLYLALVVSGCYALARSGWLSPSSSLLMLGAASLVSSIPLVVLAHPRRWGKETRLSPARVIRQHWQYGKWSAVTSAVRWSSNYAYYLLLPLHAGLQASAALRVHMNLMLPVFHANSAVYAILIPQFSKVFATHGARHLSRFTFSVVALYAAGALLFWALLLGFGEPVFALLYGGQYQSDLALLALLGLLPLSGGIAGVFESALFAAGHPKLAAVTYGLSALVTLTIGWALLAAYGVIGAGMGLLAASMATAATMFCMFVRFTRLSETTNGSARPDPQAR